MSLNDVGRVAFAGMGTVGLVVLPGCDGKSNQDDNMDWFLNGGGQPPAMTELELAERPPPEVSGDEPFSDPLWGDVRQARDQYDRLCTTVPEGADKMHLLNEIDQARQEALRALGQPISAIMCVDNVTVVAKLGK